MRKKRLVGIALLIIVIVPVMLAVHFYRRLPGAPLALGTALPPLTAQPVGGATPLPQQGRRVLLFFSPSCSYCEEIIAQLGQLRERHPEWFSGDEALKLALISIADRSETETFARRVAWPVYHDPDRQSLKALHGVGVPYLALVDENGLVRYRHQGVRGLTAHEPLLGAFHRTGQAW
ncbi:MAG: TlpA family protein disulfide reductase [Blastocatellales bacterium]